MAQSIAIRAPSSSVSRRTQDRLSMNNNLENYFVPDLLQRPRHYHFAGGERGLSVGHDVDRKQPTGLFLAAFYGDVVFVQWVCLLSVAVICPLRNVFVYLPALAAPGLAIAVVATVTLVVSVAGEYLWPTNQGLVDWWWVARNVLIGGILPRWPCVIFMCKASGSLNTGRAERALGGAASQYSPAFLFQYAQYRVFFDCHRPRQSRAHAAGFGAAVSCGAQSRMTA